MAGARAAPRGGALRPSASRDVSQPRPPRTTVHHARRIQYVPTHRTTHPEHVHPIHATPQALASRVDSLCSSLCALARRSSPPYIGSACTIGIIIIIQIAKPICACPQRGPHIRPLTCHSTPATAAWPVGRRHSWRWGAAAVASSSARPPRCSCSCQSRGCGRRTGQGRQRA